MALPQLYAHSPSPWRLSMTTLFSASLLLVALLAPAATATPSPAEADLDFLAYRTVDGTLVLAMATPRPHEPEATLIRDSRIPVKDDDQWRFLMDPRDLELQKRDTAETTGTSTSSSTSSTKKDTATKTTVTATETVTATKTKSGSSSSSSSSTSTTAASISPLPSPFDSSMASNYSGSGNCPNFLRTFLSSAEYKACYPFSMLLQGSTSFFEAEKSMSSITRVLDASCNANVTSCAAYLSTVAKNLTTSANCQTDYNLGNAVVVEAYQALTAYETLYAATCLQDPGSDDYCFAKAVTNATTPSNVYFYYLPLNISLPGASIPTCNWCVKNTMAVYRSAAANRNLAIASTYLSAAQQVDTICGPNFVNDTLPTAISGASRVLSLPGLSSPWLASLVSFIMTALVLL